MAGVEAVTTQELKPEVVLKRLQTFMDKQRERPPLQLRAAALFLIYYAVPDKTFHDLGKRLGGLVSHYGQALQMVRSVLESQVP